MLQNTNRSSHNPGYSIKLLAGLLPKTDGGPSTVVRSLTVHCMHRHDQSLTAPRAAPLAQVKMGHTSFLSAAKHQQHLLVPPCHWSPLQYLCPLCHTSTDTMQPDNRTSSSTTSIFNSNTPEFDSAAQEHKIKCPGASDNSKQVPTALLTWLIHPYLPMIPATSRYSQSSSLPHPARRWPKS